MPFCQNCGSQVQGKFCVNCGKQLTTMNNYQPVQQVSTMNNYQPVQQVLSQNNSTLMCPRCRGHNINVQMVQDRIKTNNTSCLRTVGRLILIVCTFGLWLLVPSRKENSKITHKNMAVCQNCGYSWGI